MLNKQALEEFKEIWRSELGEDLSDDKATEMAINLLTITNVVYRPIRTEWSDSE